MKKLLYSLGFMACTLFLFQAAEASCPNKTKLVFQPKWELLGTRTVKFVNDRDEIMVTSSEGLFTALKIKVLNSAMDMNKMVVHFGDGSTEDIALKNVFRAGDESRVIDLPGNKRVIKKIVFWYDTKNYKKHRAVVELWGRH